MNTETIRYSELFGPTLQGEGRYVGCSSIFLRLFGCNFRCPKFNNGTVSEGKNAEVISVINDLASYSSNQDLPLIETGCDSYMSVYPEFKNLAITETIDTIANKIAEKLPNNQWGDVHLVLTGGEPLLLGNQRKIVSLLEHDLMKTNYLTFETNGTQHLRSDLKRFLIEQDFDVTFSVSPKLSESGEAYSLAILPNIVLEYQYYGFTYLKFVVSATTDIHEIEDCIQEYRNAGFTGPVYLMPTGGTDAVYYKNQKQVAELALKMGIRYSPRLQVNLWGNEWST